MSVTQSLLPRMRNSSKRKLQKVPYVELFDGRLQGVVSSGSDPARVYVAFIEARTGGYACSTNNNRPCGGGGVCGHLQALVENAVEQFGKARVAQYLGCADAEIRGAGQVIAQLGGTHCKRDSGQVFARFLDYLRYLGLPSSSAPLPEMAFFVTG